MKCLVAIGVFLLVPLGASAQDEYTRDIKPFFAKHCVACHGPTKQKAGLRLDSAASVLAGNDAGKVIVPGKSAESLLVKVLLGDKDLPTMPPSSKPRPTQTEIAAVRRWIDAGAKAPKEDAVAGAATKSDHWSFQPIRHSTPPKVKNQAWVRNAIDQFVLARLEKDRLTPSAEADRVTLIRRASLDLLGLPPSPDEVAAFVNDKSIDAYERMVDNLLRSPHYGERWARHWLDLARYGDSNGFTIDGPRSIWPYRDWVINALNRDLPINQFILEQLAGDLVPNATTEQKVATGFHRNTLLNQEGGIDVEMFRVESIIDRVNTTGAVFLGLTVGCCQCHDHKYDPITQGEYYRLFAFFNNCDEPSLPLPSAKEQKLLAAYNAKVASLDKLLKGLDTTSPEKMKQWEALLSANPKLRSDVLAGAPRIRELVDKTASQRTKKETDELRQYLRQVDQIPQLIASVGDSFPGGISSMGAFATHAHLLKYRENIEKKLAELKKTKPEPASTLVLAERTAPRDTYFLIKGDFTRKGNKMQPGTPAVLPPLSKAEKPNRLDFAKWVVDPANPLTTRVLMNRVWQHYFGLGLVETENDFGLQGTPPSHPELLDWLASELMAQGWSLKAMHRAILTSATYRQTSKLRPELAKVDPRNRLLGRQNRLRLEAEVVRDVALSASGLLNPAIGGPSVFPPQPDGVFAFTQSQRVWSADKGADRFRRGMYTYFWRSAPHPGLMAFDAPDANTTCTRRNRSNTPLQALTLLNDRAYFEFSQALASRVLRDASDDAGAIRQAYRLCLARDPSAAEQERVQTLLSTLERELATDAKEAKRLTPPGTSATIPASRAAAWTLVSRALLNLDEFITRE
jgi:hypothetical protein